MRRLTLSSVCLLIASTSTAIAQNDECSGAVNLTLGTAIAFDTTLATTSAPVWPCAGGGNDLWYRVTATTTGALVISTCGSSFDTALEVFTGPCAALVPVACNDDACALSSQLAIPSTAGTTYTIRVGGFAALTGFGTLIASHPAPVTNDECTGAVALVNGAPVNFDTTSASLSATPWPCAGAIAPDVWYRYTATNSGVSLRVQTCGSFYDTALEVFDGTCGALNSLACNDDACGLQSEVLLTNLVSGRTYTIRVGGFGAASGGGSIVAIEGQPPVQGCVLNPGFETGDASGWTLTDIAAPFVAAAVTASGTTPGFGLFASAPTEGAFALTHGFDGGGPGLITLAQDVTVVTGLTPLTFDYRAGWDMLNYPGSTLDRTFDVVVRNPMSGAVLQTTRILTAMPGTLNLDTGALAGNVNLAPFLGQTVRVSFEWTIPENFTGPGHFQLDNVSCPSGGGGIGTNYCNGNPNSTGAVGSLRGAGSASVAANDLTLVAADLPANAFGFFLTSPLQAVVPNPGGSQGVLCLGGGIGRYVGPGQIKNSGAMGTFSLLLNLAQTPTPTGFVSVTAGQTRNFQAWHRDSAGGGATSNFTVGLSVTFL